MAQNPRTPSRLGLAALVAAWLLAVGGGAAWLAAYSTRPGADAPGPARWPPNSQIEPAAGRLTLVLFAHPHCPCSRATLAELARVMARGSDLLAATVLFVRPAEATSWGPTDLWRQAAAIPGVTPRWDDGGEEAARFGARTSGHAFVFDAAGALRFRGGLTAARGHEGGNPGRDAVLALALGEQPGRAETPVFGCPLQTPLAGGVEGAP